MVEVQNTGSKLTSEEVARVFDRFYRADPSRQRATGGTGLGLAIVKNLVEAHGGRVLGLTRMIDLVLAGKKDEVSRETGR